MLDLRVLLGLIRLFLARKRRTEKITEPYEYKMFLNSASYRHASAKHINIIHTSVVVVKARSSQ